MAEAQAQSVQLLSPPRTRVWVHAGLLLLTIGTTTLQGYALGKQWPGSHLLNGLAFSGTLLAILLSHEMGHYVFARIHRIDTTLPYVIPAPPGLTLGTLGAVIRMRSPIATRDALIDVGASGPIAGAIVALPLLVIGLRLSTIIPSPTGQESFWFGHQTLWTALVGAWHWAQSMGAHSAAAASLPQAESFGDNLLMRGMTWLVFGKIPPGSDVYVHPVAIAAWFGLLVTCLNLFPMGQLDGGHVSYAVFGPRGHRWLSEIVSAALLLLAFVSSLSWTVWWLVTRFALGFQHPPVEQGGTRIGPLRAGIALVSLALFIATFVPVPLDQM